MHDDMMNRPDDHEAKMARADLFKLAQYSFKLFKMIGENQELEGWVQAKITKSADYIASVYHYLEYEMKISEFGDHLENAEMYSESVRRAFQQKLTEAKKQAEKAKETLKKKEKELDEGQAPMNPDGATAPPPKGKDGQYPIVTSGPNKGKRWSPQTPGPTNPAMKEGKKGDGNLANNAKPYDKVTRGDVIAGRLGKDEKGGKKVKEEFDKVGDTKKTRTGELTKTATGVKHKRTDYTDDEHGEAPSTVKQKSAAEKKADKANDIKLPKHKGNTWGMKGGEKFGKKMEDTAVPDPQAARAARASAANAMANQAEPTKPVKEGKCNHTPKGKPCPVHGLKECGSMYEASHQEKTTMKHVKNPTAGEKKAAKDIKPGVAGYSDRVAMLKSAEKDGRLKEASSAKQQAAIAIAKKKAK
jgi:hypothetical protein